MLRLVKRAVVVLFSLIGALAAAAALWAWSQGISTRPAPGTLETAIARRARSLAIPSNVRTRTNPEASTPTALRSGLEHFADHCASCHANDGSGDTPIGRGLYPRAPDMRLPATQDLSDGELFYIIEHGVRLTGMPAWGTGTPEGEAASWHLVQFIRHLPALTGAELEIMNALNPRSAAEWRDEEAVRRFLAGDDGAATPAGEADDHGGHR
jgi:mono/diheme cytochrome c family protein